MSINGKGTGKGIKKLIGVGNSFDKHGHLQHKWPSDETLAIKYRHRVRHGKTANDHSSGAWKQRFGHRALRDAFTRLNPLDNRARTINEGWKIGTPAPAM